MATLHKARNPGLWLPRRQPRGAVRIDWTHPLANGLVGLWSPVWGMRNLVGTGGDLLPQGNPTIRAGATGLEAVDSSGNQRRNTTVPSTLQPSGAHSIMWFGTIGAGDNSDNPALLACFYTTFNTPPFMSWGLHTWYSGSSNIAVVAAFGGSLSVYEANGALTRGESVHYVSTATPGGSAILYKDGAQYGSGSFASGAVAYSSTPVLIAGGHISNTSAHCGGGMSIAGLWSRALSAEEARRLSSEPYAMLIPAG